MNVFKADNKWTDWLAAVVIFALAALMPFYVWHENTSGFLTDDGMYLLMADFFSPYYEGNALVHHLAMNNARFPPAFPLLIAILGGGSENMPIAHLVTGMTFLMCGGLLYFWIRQMPDQSNMALVCLLIYIALPETLIYVLELRSEFLFLVLVFAVFTLLESTQSSKKQELLCLVAFLIGISILTRSVGICLLAAFCVYLWIHGISKKILYICIAAILPLCWQVIKIINGYSNSYLDDVIHYASFDGFWQLVTHNIPIYASLIYQAWLTNLGIGEEAEWFRKALGLLLLLLATFGLLHRIKGKHIDAYFLLFYITLISVWPHPNHMIRFIYPVSVTAIIYIFIGAFALKASIKEKWLLWSRVATVLCTVFLIYPKASYAIEKFVTPLPDHIPDSYRLTRIWLQKNDLKKAHWNFEIKSNVVTLLRRVDDLIQARECIYSEHTALTMLYTHRPAIYLPSDLSPGKLNQCKYLFVMNLVVTHQAKYPLYEIDHDRLELVDIQYDINDEQQAYLFKILN